MYKKILNYFHFLYNSKNHSEMKHFKKIIKLLQSECYRNAVMKDQLTVAAWDSIQNPTFWEDFPKDTLPFPKNGKLWSITFVLNTRIHNCLASKIKKDFMDVSEMAYVGFK